MKSGRRKAKCQSSKSIKHCNHSQGTRKPCFQCPTPHISAHSRTTGECGANSQHNHPCCISSQPRTGSTLCPVFERKKIPPKQMLFSQRHLQRTTTHTQLTLASESRFAGSAGMLSSTVLVSTATTPTGIPPSLKGGETQQNPYFLCYTTRQFFQFTSQYSEETNNACKWRRRRPRCGLFEEFRCAAR